MDTIYSDTIRPPRRRQDSWLFFRHGTVRIVRRHHRRRPPGGRQRDQPGAKGDRAAVRLQGLELVDRVQTRRRADPARGRQRLSDARAVRRRAVQADQARRLGKEPRHRRGQAGGRRGDDTVRRGIKLKTSLDPDTAKKVAAAIKDAKLKKVQASIQGDQVRVSSPSKDDLQEAMALLRSQDFGVELKFGNYR